MKRAKIISTIIICIGVIVILYPYISDYIFKINNQVTILEYDKEIESLEREIIDKKIENVKEQDENLYEQNLFNAKLEDFKISTNSSLEILGYIDIPKINVKLPIYEGSSNNVLKKGIGHLEDTSSLVGGNSTHSVLVGHTGLKNCVMFDNLNELEIDDIFYIKTYNKVLKYKVKEKNIVLPENTDSLKIKENEDLCTLVTCTPKHVNTHRLLVTGTFIEEIAKDSQEVEKEDNDFIVKTILHIKYKNKANYKFFMSLLLVVIVGILIFAYRKLTRKKLGKM